MAELDGGAGYNEVHPRAGTAHTCSQSSECPPLLLPARVCSRARALGAPAPASAPSQVLRLSSQDVPTSYAYELEAATIVQPEQVVAAVQKVCGVRAAA